MATVETQRPLETSWVQAEEIYQRLVVPHLSPEDTDKFCAFDLDSGDFELDRDGLPAIDRLRARRPNSRTWLLRVGWGCTDRLSGRRATLTGRL